MTTADFNFVTRRATHDPLAVVAAFAGLGPLPHTGPDFNFTTRRGLHDVKNVVAAFASIAPIPHTGPDFDFTIRRGRHDPKNVVAQFGVPPAVVTLPGGEPQASTVRVYQPSRQRLLMRPLPDAAQQPGPTFTGGAGNHKTIYGLFGPSSASSGAPTFKNRPVVELTRPGDDFAGYGTVKVTLAPGARNVTLALEDDDPPMPGWPTFRRKR